jgi:hypothetical protein
MLALIEHSPDIYLDKIQDQLYEQHNIDISLPIIQAELTMLQLSKKAAERCEEARAIFHLRWEQKPPSR